MAELDVLYELLNDLEKATLEQSKLLVSLAEDEPETKNLKAKLHADFAEIDRLKKEISKTEKELAWKPKSVSEYKKLLFDVSQKVELDKIINNDVLFGVGFIAEQAKIARKIINFKNNNKESTNNIETINSVRNYDFYIEKGINLLDNIIIDKKELIHDNKLKTEITKEWKKKGLSNITENQWTRSIVLWASTKKYKNVVLDFLKYIPKKYYDIPYMFRNLIKSNFEQKDKILKFIPETYTEEQKNLINTVIKEAEMLFEVHSLDDENKKITLSVKEKNNETIFITTYQYLRIKKEVGEKYKVHDKNGNEYRVSVIKKTKLH